MRKFFLIFFFTLLIISLFYQYRYNEYASSSDTSPTQKTSSTDSGSDIDQSASHSAENTIQAKPISASEIFSINEEFDLVMGNKNAKVILIEYSSPTCPSCAYYHQAIYPKIKKEYIDNNKIGYVVREFVSNQADLHAAVLNRCLNDKNDPIKMLTILYQQQDNWAFNKNYKEILDNIGLLAGISKDKYNACLKDEKMIERIANHSRAITFDTNFTGTPAFFINGSFYKGMYSFEALANEINSILNNSK